MTVKSIVVTIEVYSGKKWEMFRGRVKSTVDNKGRTSLPSRFREVLRNRYGNEALMITTGFENNLVAFPIAEWERFEDKVSKMSRFDPRVIKLKRFFISGAVECRVDSHGRISLPQYLREYAKINKEIYWIGLGDSIEIWSSERWEENMKELLESKDELAKAISELGL